MTPRVSFWSSDPSEIARWLGEKVAELAREPQADGFEEFLDLAEEANEIGLLDVAGQILAAARPLTERLSLDVERHLVLSRIENIAGVAADHAGRLDEAMARYLAAIEHSRAAGSLLAEALAQQNLAGILWYIDGTSSAREHALMALDIYEQLGDRFRQAQMLVNLANYDVDDQRYEVAMQRLDRAELLATARGAIGLRTSIVGTRAMIATAQGDLALAGKFHRQVLARARRGDTLSNTRNALQNMGAWYADTGKHRLAAPWLKRAADLAVREGNLPLAATLLRSQAIQEMKSGRLDLAQSTMRSAVELSDANDDDRGAAEGRADLAAILLTAAHSLPAGDLTRTENLDEAEALMAVADRYFQAFESRAWMNRIAGNAISLALLQGRPEEALERLTRARDATNEVEGSERLELDRRGLSIAVSELRQPELAAAFVRDVAGVVATGRAISEEELPGGGRSEALSGSAASAWQLALGAAFLRNYEFAWAEAIGLLLEAQSLLDPEDALWFHVTNDLGSAFADVGDLGRAMECFDACLALSRRREDRYMRQQALANRGETMRRTGDVDAIPLLEEAVVLARTLLDSDAEVGSLLNLMWANIDRRDLRSAERALKAATATVGTTEGPSSERLRIAHAGLAFAKGDYQESYRWHRQLAADTLDPEEQVGFLVDALRDLERCDDRPTYRRLLGQVERAAQKSQLDEQLSRLVLPIAGEWLRRGADRLAARTYADALLLAISAMLKVSTIPNRDQDTSWDPLANAIVEMNLAIGRGAHNRDAIVGDVFSRVRETLPQRGASDVLDSLERMSNAAWDAVLQESSVQPSREYFDLPPDDRPPPLG